MEQVVIDSSSFVAPLEAAGFEYQLLGETHVLVRNSPELPLFERIEVLQLGNDTVIGSVSIAVVGFAVTQRRGLIINSAIKELPEDPITGKCSFTTNAQWNEWTERLVRYAPGRARELAATRGDKLLASTFEWRTRANRIFDMHVTRMIRDGRLGPRTLLSPTQILKLETILARPMLVTRGLEGAGEAAIAGLLLDGGPDVDVAADHKVVPISFVRRLTLVPESFSLTFSLVVDLILRSSKKQPDRG